MRLYKKVTIPDINKVKCINNVFDLLFKYKVHVLKTSPMNYKF